MLPIPNYYDQEGKDPVASAIIWMRKRRAGKAVLLAFASLIFMSLAWTLLPPHTVFRRTIAATFLPGIAANKLLAGLLANAGVTEPRRVHAYAIVGFVFLTHVIFWYALLGATRKRHASESPVQEPTADAPETLIREG